MERQIQKPGFRKWYGDDFIKIQDELYTAIEAFGSKYGNFILSGCAVTGSSIGAGIVYIGGKVCRFYGATGVAFPCYLVKIENETDNRAYRTGSLPTELQIKAIIQTSLPTGDYITISATGGLTFRDAIQDANNRMVTDSQISSWNGKDASAINTIRGTILAAYNTLGKLYDWVATQLSGKIDKTTTASGTANQTVLVYKSGYAGNNVIIELGQNSSDGYVSIKNALGVEKIRIDASTGEVIAGNHKLSEKANKKHNAIQLKDICAESDSSTLLVLKKVLKYLSDNLGSCIGVENSDLAWGRLIGVTAGSDYRRISLIGGGGYVEGADGIICFGRLSYTYFNSAQTFETNVFISGNQIIIPLNWKVNANADGDLSKEFSAKQILTNKIKTPTGPIEFEVGGNSVKFLREGVLMASIDVNTGIISAKDIVIS